MNTRELHTRYAHSRLERLYLDFLENPKIQVVSFDIFDTLVHRKCNHPHDVFELMAANPCIAETFLSPIHFSRSRQVAEKRAYELRGKDEEETSLQKIYSLLFPNDPLKQEQFTDIEVQEEIRQIYADEQMQRWISFAKDAGKKVIVTSDMYLSQEQIEIVALGKLSRRELIDEVYISSNLQKRKSTGSLFEHILHSQNISSEDLLHIGDNPHSDIVMAQKLGIKTIHYAPTSSTSERFALEYQALINPKNTLCLRKNADRLNPYLDDDKAFFYSLGATVLGAVIFSFCQWILETMQKMDIPHLSLLMREGKLIETCLKKLQPKIQTTLIYASRRSTFLASRNNGNLQIANTIHYKNITIRGLYSLYNITMPPVFKPFENIQCQNTSNYYLDNQTLETVLLKDLATKRDEVLLAADNAKEAIEAYIQKLSIPKGSFLVEFGAGATINSSLESILPNSFAGHLFFYLRESGYENMLGYNALTYIPYGADTKQAIDLIRRSPMAIEQLLNGTEPTTIGYNDGLPVLQKLQNRQNFDELIKAFHSGIFTYFDLATDFKDKTVSYTPNDALKTIARLIDVPTYNEAKYLGSLWHDEGNGGELHSLLISDDQIAEIQNLGTEKFYTNFLQNINYLSHRFSWPQALLTVVDANFLKVRKGQYKPSKNEEAITELLHQIDTLDVKSLIIYGAGAIFKELIPHLQTRKIHIAAVCDKQAAIRPYTIDNFNIITLEDALSHHISVPILIASAAFADEIASYIRSLSKQTCIKI